MRSPSMRTIFILTTESVTREGISYVIVYGASNEGPVRLHIPFLPYFFASTRDSAATAHEIGAVAADSAFTAIDGTPLQKLTFSTIESANNACRELRRRGFLTYESDIRARERYFMDCGINAVATIEGEYESTDSILVFRNPRLTPGTEIPKFTTCSFDIETSMSDGSVLSIAVDLSGRASDQRIFMRGSGPCVPDLPIEYHPNEGALITAFTTWLHESDPDILIGWNVIGFDISVLSERSRRLGVPFKIGRDRRALSTIERRGRLSRVVVPGRIVLDGPQLLRTSFFSFEGYSLEAVAQDVLGKGKLIASNENKGQEIERLFREDPIALGRYNLLDAVLVREIFEKLQLTEMTVRRSQLSGMRMDTVGMSIAAFDHYCLPRLHAAGYAAPDAGDIEKSSGSSGGYVIAPEAGLYDRVIGLDFRSLYPSIICTFGIDPLSRLESTADPLLTPTGYSFSRTRHMLPDLIRTLMQERVSAKAAGNAPLSQAIKILMNSFYGVMGAYGSRLFHPDLAEAITTTGQWILLESKEWLEKQGHTVIYGDTDSLFVIPKKDLPAEPGRELAAQLTAYWHDRLQAEYHLASMLIVECKNHYDRFLVPAARGNEGGTKKRYAGFIRTGDSHTIEFVGLEVVRSDSTPLARQFQRELYERIFRDEPLRDWLRGFVSQLKNGEHDHNLVYRKRLHKPATEYGDSPPPYVRAAQALGKPVREIHYVITKSGPVPIQHNPTNPDYDHYIGRQLKPVADSALELLGTSFDDLIGMQSQLKLFS